MGIFDLFTGAPAKRAAEENSARIKENLATGTAAINTGQTGALGALDASAAAYAPLNDLATRYTDNANKYGGLYTDALGLNGADGSARAQSAFTTGPGYQQGINAGLDVLNRRRAGAGMLQSGNADLDALKFGQDSQNREYTNWLSNLSGLNTLNQGQALSATGAVASGTAAANAGKAGVYQNSANNIVGLNSNATTGLNDQNTQAANAQMAGSRNLWGFGMAAAQAAAGMPPTGMGGGSSGGIGSAFGFGSTPDYGQTQNMRVGNYSMPMFGRFGS